MSVTDRRDLPPPPPGRPTIAGPTRPEWLRVARAVAIGLYAGALVAWWATTGIPRATCRAYLGDLDYGFSYRHLAGLTDFFRRLAQDGLVPDGSLSFITAA